MTNNKNTPAYTSGTWKKPEGLRSLGSFILLCIVTLGIYFLYWIYKTTELANEDKTEKQHSPVAQLLLCIFIPYYEVYWFWKTSKKIEHLADSVGVTADNAMLNLVLCIFGLDFIAGIILQDSINKALCASTGATVNATGEGHCKHCDATFPNDADVCPKCGAPYKKPFTQSLAFPIIIGIVAILLILGLIAGGLIAALNATDGDLFGDQEISSIEEGYDPEDPSTWGDDFDVDFDLDGDVFADEDTTDGAEATEAQDTAETTEATEATPVDVPEDAVVTQTANGKWALVSGNEVITGFNGIATNEYGTWYIENGYVNFDYNGTITVDGKNYTIQKGKVVEQ